MIPISPEVTDKIEWVDSILQLTSFLPAEGESGMWIGSTQCSPKGKQCLLLVSY
jgi:hypothetical protein